MKSYFKVLLILSLVTIKLYGQLDSLRLGDKYWEDQLYLNLSYDILNNQPESVADSGFSYSFSAGYIKDIPINKKGTVAFGVGIGYGFSSYNNTLQVINTRTVQLPNNISSNKIKLHNLEFPLQIRWRKSDAITYAFWRFYGGVKFSYNLSNKFSYNKSGEATEFNNVDLFNNFQSGLEFSGGYGAFNLYFYYGLNSIYKNTLLNSEEVNTRVVKFGLIFYLL